MVREFADGCWRHCDVFVSVARAFRVESPEEVRWWLIQIKIEVSEERACFGGEDCLHGGAQSVEPIVTAVSHVFMR